MVQAAPGFIAVIRMDGIEPDALLQPERIPNLMGRVRPQSLPMQGMTLDGLVVRGTHPDRRDPLNSTTPSASGCVVAVALADQLGAALAGADPN